MDRSNPYEAPKSEVGGMARDPRRDRRIRALIVLVKVALLIIGLWLLVSPESPAPNAAFHQGQILAKAIGSLLLVLAAVPYRAPSEGRGVGDAAEDL
jgi:amino acid transporter